MYIKDTSLLSSINADYFKLLFWKHRGKTKLVNCLNGMILINMSSLLDPISIISKSPSNAFIKSDNKCIWENHKCILSRGKKKIPQFCMILFPFIHYWEWNFVDQFHETC